MTCRAVFAHTLRNTAAPLTHPLSPTPPTPVPPRSPLAPRPSPMLFLMPYLSYESLSTSRPTTSSAFTCARSSAGTRSRCYIAWGERGARGEKGKAEQVGTVN